MEINEKTKGIILLFSLNIVKIGSPFFVALQEKMEAGGALDSEVEPWNDQSLS